MVGKGRSGEPKKSLSPIMCWIYAWQILSHNMSLIYACPRVWAIIIKEAVRYGPMEGAMRTVEVLLRWRGDVTFRRAKTVRFVNSSGQLAHTLRGDNYLTAVQLWMWRFHQIPPKKRMAVGTVVDFWFTQQQGRIQFYISLSTELLTSSLNSIPMNKVFWVTWNREASFRGRCDTDVMCCQPNTPAHNDGNVFNHKSSTVVHAFHLSAINMQFSWLNMMIIQMSLM